MITGYDGNRGPPRAGLGAQGAPQNLPVPNLPGANGAGGDGGNAGGPAEKFSLFISGVPSSLSDARLQQILEVSRVNAITLSFVFVLIVLLLLLCCQTQTVGTVVNINRIRDASGKPKAFGFVEYADAEAVLRCIELLNGIQLIGQDREQKALTVKADAKLRSRLDEHEAGRMKTSVSS
jgi:RNA-binding protein 25